MHDTTQCPVLERIDFLARLVHRRQSPSKNAREIPAPTAEATPTEKTDRYQRSNPRHPDRLRFIGLAATRGEQPWPVSRQAILSGASFYARVCHPPDGGARKEADRRSDYQRAPWMPANHLPKATGDPGHVMLLEV
jgi:hypothetical protein